MKIKLMEWNIKGSASLGWNNNYKIKKEVVNKMIAQKSDIVVLTEFVVAQGVDYLFEQLENRKYIWFLECESGKNGILICIKEELVNKTLLMKNIYKGKIVSSVNKDCNILLVKLPLKSGSTISVMGFRMEVETANTKSLREQYDSERKCFDEILIPMIDENEKTYIICGDFNNARCLGNLNEKYNKEDYKEKVQVNYNLNIIKDKFEDINFVMADIKENGESVPTYNGYIPDDHIFVRGFKRNTCSRVSADGLSDHDIITATVELCDYTIRQMKPNEYSLPGDLNI